MKGDKLDGGRLGPLPARRGKRTINREAVEAMMRRTDANNFNNWRTITASRASSPHETSCGHAIQAGERIGYNHRTRAVKCAGC